MDRLSAPGGRRFALWKLHRHLYDWVLRWSAHPKASWALFALAFAESSVFPVPPDVLLLAMVFAAPERARAYAALTTAGSVAGGLAGYGLGWGLWQVVGPLFFRHLGPFGFTSDNFRTVQHAYQDNAFLAIFTAAFTPIPYKVFTVAAGVFGIGMTAFVVASVLGRGMRFFLVAELGGRVGPAVKPFIERYLGWLTLAFAALLAAGYYAIRYATR